MNSSIAIVAHVDRNDAATELCIKTRADIIMLDHPGLYGAEANHLRAWTWHAENTTAEWSVVLEDDAEPVNGFRQQLEAALAVAPAPIVSLYLGTGYPKTWQPRIRNTIRTAGDPHWLLTNSVLHAVAIAIRTDLLPITLTPHVAIDAALGNWAKKHGHHVAYSWPSLVDHADGPTLVTTRHSASSDRTDPRKAWQTGTRPHWANKTAALGH